MEPDQESTEDLRKELETALLKVRQLEGLLLSRGRDGWSSASMDSTSESPQERTTEPTRTSTLDLTSLFHHDVSSSGSFKTKGIRSTLFGRLLEALPVPALLVTRSREVIFANRAWGRAGISYEDILSKRFSDLFPAESVAQEVDSLAESVFITRKVFSTEAVLAVEERVIWGQLTLRSIRLGPQRLLLVLIEDLTAQKRQLLQKQEYEDSLKREIRRRQKVEKDLRESQQRLELALKGAELSLWDWNVARNHLVLDKGFVEALGHSLNEIGPHKDFWYSVIHPDDRPRVRAAMKKHIRGASTFFESEYRVCTKAGEWKWMLARGSVLLRNKQGKPLRALGTNLDITHRKELEERSRLYTLAMIQAADRERDRISLDLHDLVTQDLVALKLGLDTMLDEYPHAPPALSLKLAQASEWLLQMVTTVREISYHLRPAGLDKLGLLSTLSEYCREFEERHNISVQFLVSGMEEARLDFDTEINLFRVVQESLNNVKKHAKACNIMVRLTGSEGHITLSVRDDGRGFTSDKLASRDSVRQQMGLWSIEQRAAILNGKLEVRTKPEEGTEIYLEIPVNGLNHAHKTDRDC